MVTYQNPSILAHYFKQRVWHNEGTSKGARMFYALFAPSDMDAILTEEGVQPEPGQRDAAFKKLVVSKVRQECDHALKSCGAVQLNTNSIWRQLWVPEEILVELDVITLPKTQEKGRPKPLWVDRVEIVDARKRFEKPEELQFKIRSR